MDGDNKIREGGTNATLFITTSWSQISDFVNFCKARDMDFNKTVGIALDKYMELVKRYEGEAEERSTL